MKPGSMAGRAWRAAAMGMCVSAAAAAATSAPGYFRMPALGPDALVFVAEGDLWRTGVAGGTAQRLTSNLAEEAYPAISPDGKSVAFTARYEGPAEVYVMPLGGGMPARLTFDGAAAARVTGWTPDGKIVYATTRYSGKPAYRLYTLDPASGERTPVPLAEAAEACYQGATLVFARRPALSDNVKGYRGGRAQSIWKFDGQHEAEPLTADFAGTNRQPMCWQGRVYFLSDRDGAMNLWSMDAAGGDARQHTRHQGWDIRGASLSGGRIAYQLGADLHLYDIAKDTDRTLDIALVSDFEHLRTRWIKAPFDYVTDIDLAPAGDRIALTARGQVFVAPAGAGRRVEVTRASSARARGAAFMPDGKSVIAFSDAGGESELWKFPANGAGAAHQLTHDATVLRRGALPSPDGKWIVHFDKDRKLYLLNVASGVNRMIDSSPIDQFDDFAWSPDSRWLVYGKSTENYFERLWLLEIATQKSLALTGTRYHAQSPVFSPDGKFLYFLSDRNLQTVVTNPWGQRGPEPFFDRQTRIYGLALAKGARWPFLPKDELQAPEDAKPVDADTPLKKSDVRPEPGAEPKAKPESVPNPRPETRPATPARPEPEPKPAEIVPEKQPPAERPGTPQRSPGEYTDGADAVAADPLQPELPGKPGVSAQASKVGAGAAAKRVAIDLDGLSARLYQVPLPAGNYSALATDGKRLYFLASDTTAESRKTLRTLPIEATNPAPPTAETFFDDVRSYQLSLDGKKVLVRRKDDLWVFDAGAKAPPDVSKAAVPLKDWTFQLDPREEWRQMFADAWRMHRDYFYDRAMKGVDWAAVRAKYAPLAERVTDRAELNDVIAQMSSELSLLHSQVFTPDLRKGTDDVDVGALAADLRRVKEGYRVERVYSGDPELIEERSPLAYSEVGVAAGDVLTHINGVALDAAHPPGLLLRNQAGKQVLIGVLAANKASSSAKARDVIVTPLTAQRDAQIRYLAWEGERRSRVETASRGRIGYVHLQAMGPGDIAQWAREFYPVFDREGLILDLRGNNGGNIDSWIIEKLQRRVWAYWQSRSSAVPVSNQQVTFRGHVVAIVDADTYSDGETMAEALRRLGIAPLVGARTSGAGVWLSDGNRLRDNGIARAAESGQFGLDGKWLIEGVGVAPDVAVDNLPHATFNGGDAQLDAALRVLEEKIAKEPLPAVRVPPYPRPVK